MNNSATKTSLATIFALLAFAGNSVLCRLALGNQAIDATSFTIIRLFSGALALSIIFIVGRKIVKHNRLFTSNEQTQTSAKKWLASSMLFVYAAGFSYAYIALDTGVGALVLFGSVQLTMIAVSIYRKEYLAWYKWLGLIMAFSGLCFLVYSQVNWSSANLSFIGFLLMVLAGVAWGTYTLIGRGSVSPLIDTNTSFMLSTFLCIPLLLVYWFIPALLTEKGFWLAIASGVVTSALGYAIWYIALSGLSRLQAGVVQLLVPVIAAIGGLVWIGEAITNELIVAQVLVICGILLVMINRSAKS